MLTQNVISDSRPPMVCAKTVLPARFPKQIALVACTAPMARSSTPQAQVLQACVWTLLVLAAVPNVARLDSRPAMVCAKTVLPARFPKQIALVACTAPMARSRTPQAPVPLVYASWQSVRAESISMAPMGSAKRVVLAPCQSLTKLVVSTVPLESMPMVVFANPTHVKASRFRVPR
jgi:hypothetical protein